MRVFLGARRGGFSAALLFLAKKFTKPTRGGVFEGTCRSGWRKNSAAKRLTKQKKRYTMICDLNRKVRLTVKG